MDNMDSLDTNIFLSDGIRPNGHRMRFSQIVYGRSNAPRGSFRSKCQVKTLLHERKQQKKGDDTIAANPDNANPMSASNADEMDEADDD